MDEDQESELDKKNRRLLKYFINGTITQYYGAHFKDLKQSEDETEITIYINHTYDDFLLAHDANEEYEYFPKSKAVITKDLWEEIKFTNPKNRIDYEKFLATVSMYILREYNKLNTVTLILEKKNSADILNLTRDAAQDFIEHNSETLDSLIRGWLGSVTAGI